MYICRIYSDYNLDNSDRILEDWVKKHGDEYGAVYVTMDSNRTGYEYPDETEIGQWTENHMEHVIELREKALVFARESGADYLLVSTSKDTPLYYSIARSVDNAETC